MADTRRANRSYQFDVDTMMVEYSLYQAVKALIKTFRGETTVDAARHLSQIFDGLMRAYNTNHPTTTLQEGAQLNIRILQFLVLLRRWYDTPLLSSKSDGTSTNATTAPMTASMTAQLRRERLVNAAFRTHWLHVRNSQRPGQSQQDETGLAGDGVMGPGMDVLPAIDIEGSPLPLLRDLTPRFLDISEEIAMSLCQPINQQWMDLAATFMLQSAIDVLELSVNRSSSEAAVASPQPTSSSRRDQASHQRGGMKTDEMRKAVEECFAWGFVERRRYANNPKAITAYTLKTMEASTSMRGLFGYSQKSVKLLSTVTKTIDVEDRIWETFHTHGSMNLPHSSSKSEHSSSGDQDVTMGEGIENDDGPETAAAQHEGSITSPGAVGVDGATPSSTNKTGDDVPFTQVSTATTTTSSSSAPASSGELSDWTKIREKAEEEILLSLENIQEAEGQDEALQAVEMLRRRHPQKEFAHDLVDFIEGIWDLHSRDEWQGKPVLIQIEEGRLQGLNREEFEAFSDRVRLT